jgi:anti-sigma regulatory factor (Ser/Thr protein kinase)
MGSREWTFPGDPRDVSEARHRVGLTISSWGLQPLCDDLSLLVSEVVTNAIRHGHGPVTLQIQRRPTGVRVEVSDLSTETITLQATLAAHHQEYGRGLGIVDHLASAWGTTDTWAGTTVWFELGAS